MRDGVIFYQDKIFLARASKVKEKILHVAYEILISKPTGFIRACHTILEGFMWEGFKEEMHYHMRKCIDCLEGEEKHSSWEEL